MTTSGLSEERHTGQARKRSRNSNFVVRTSSGLLGLFHVKRWRPKSSVSASKPRENKHFVGYPGISAGISRGRPKSLKKTSVFQGPLNGGGFKRGGFPDLDLSFLFCSFWDFPDFSGIFPICSGLVRGFSRFVLFLFLGLLRAPTRNSSERVRDTIWLKKWETPRFGNTPV